MDPLDAIPDMITQFVDQCRAAGDERSAALVEQAAPLVGAFVHSQRGKSLQSRAFFIADMAARILQGSTETLLDSGETPLPAVRRAVQLCALILEQAEKAANERFVVT